VFFNGWREEFEPRLRGGEYPAAVQSHFMKYRSLFASLALIFEAVEMVGSVEGAGKAVRRTSALRAAAWCEYLESHAMRVYSPSFDVATVAAKNLLERLEGGEIEHGEKVRDIYNRQWARLATKDDVAAAIEVLEQHGWARRVMAKPGPQGGRPSEVLYIHPELRS
jgi:hypothetical protein